MRCLLLLCAYVCLACSLALAATTTIAATTTMKGSPCCAGLMRSCLHTYRTKNQLDSAHHPTMGGGISQVWGGHQPSMGGSSTDYGGASAKYGGVINRLWGGISQVWGGHQPSMGGSSTSYGGGHQPTMGGASAKYGGGIFPPVCTGSQNPQNYFSNTYVLPSVNRTAGPIMKPSGLPCVIGWHMVTASFRSLLTHTGWIETN